MVWPFGCVCQAVRAPGLKWTLLALTRDASDGIATASMWTEPVNHSRGPGTVSIVFLVICIAVLLSRYIGTSIGSVVPADDHPPLDITQRQGRRLRLDRLAFGARETAPGLDRYCPQRTSPCPDDLAVDQDAARPDASRPERAPTRGVRDQELTIQSLEKEIRVAARQEPRGSRGP